MLLLLLGEEEWVGGTGDGRGRTGRGDREREVVFGDSGVGIGLD